jgi:predicted transcriptional regulator
VYEVLMGLGGASSPKPEDGAPRKPAVPIRRSVHDDFVICLDCGAKAQMLRRHLRTAHGLTPDGYRQRWNLPASYAVVAPKYAARRSELAKSAGLGNRKGSTAD